MVDLIALAYAILRFILRALDLWSFAREAEYLAWVKENEERRQRREKAVEDATKAETEEDAFNAQEKIVDNKPKP